MCIYLQTYPQLIPFFQQVSEINLLIPKHSRDTSQIYAQFNSFAWSTFGVYVPEGKQRDIDARDWEKQQLTVQNY